MGLPSCVVLLRNVDAVAARCGDRGEEGHGVSSLRGNNRRRWFSKRSASRSEGSCGCESMRASPSVINEVPVPHVAGTVVDRIRAGSHALGTEPFCERIALDLIGPYRGRPVGDHRHARLGRTNGRQDRQPVLTEVRRRNLKVWIPKLGDHDGIHQEAVLPHEQIQHMETRFLHPEELDRPR